MTPSKTELHWRVYKNEPKISSKDFPKVNDPTISGVYGNVFCLDKSTWSPSFKVRIVADQKWKKSLIFCTPGAGAKDSEGIQSASIGPRMDVHPLLRISQNIVFKPICV